MSELISINQPAALTSSARTLDGAIAAWLQAKYGRSKSELTRRDYATAIASFRAQLQAARLDLDAPAHLVALAAQAWASAGDVGAATHNKRLAIVSSFYDYAFRHGILPSNPIGACERRPVQRYAQSQAIGARQVLASIDQAAPAGLRDYALLAVTLQTGRRLAEIAALRLADMHQDADRVLLTFRRAKGGKVMRDTLPAATSRALMRYLHKTYGADLGDLAPGAPLWISYSRNNAGGALSSRAIQGICEQHAGTHFHALRHTFAQSMEKSGATISEIQQRLGHASAATTSIYLAALRSDENPHADALADLFGVE